MSSLDITQFFASMDPRRRTRDKVVVEVTRHSYLPAMELDYGWLPKSRLALQRLAFELRNEGQQVESFCSVGVGPGIEVIAAVEALGLSKVIVTDLHPEVVRTARKNIVSNCYGFKLRNVSGFSSSLCSSLLSENIRADIIYENLPNLPIAGGFELGEGSLTASFFDSHGYDDVPDEVSRNMLSLHYAFLCQAGMCLESGGSVVCCIGARVPLSQIQKIFAAQGFSFEPMICDMVLQLQAGEVLAHYQSAEDVGGVEFEFYRFDPAHEAIRSIGGSRADASVEVLREKLREFRVNASIANLLHHMGERIGHLGLVVRGRKIG